MINYLEMRRGIFLLTCATMALVKQTLYLNVTSNYVKPQNNLCHAKTTFQAPSLTPSIPSNLTSYFELIKPNLTQHSSIITSATKLIYAYSSWHCSILGFSLDLNIIVGHTCIEIA